MKVASVTGPNVRSCLKAARVAMGLKLAASRETTRSGGEDNLYRCTLADGSVVECALTPRQPCGEVVLNYDPMKGAAYPW